MDWTFYSVSSHKVAKRCNSNGCSAHVPPQPIFAVSAKKIVDLNHHLLPEVLGGAGESVLLVDGDNHMGWEGAHCARHKKRVRETSMPGVLFACRFSMAAWLWINDLLMAQKVFVLHAA